LRLSHATPTGHPRRPGPAHHQALAKAQVTGTPLARAPVEGVRRRHLCPQWRSSHRYVHHQLTAAVNRSGAGPYPAVVNVLAPVLHQRQPRTLLVQRVPHVGKSLTWHVRVAHEVVLLPQQLLSREAADLPKASFT
jgi:hypothetical protein